MRARICPIIAFALLAPAVAAAGPTIERRLARLAPDLDRDVLALALQAKDCRSADESGHRLAIIDYSKPSTEKRLWVFDVNKPRLLFHEYVAHGRGSGENYATSFSNTSGSFQSSLGLYRTADTYDGGNGYTLRLEGLDPGFNDRARERYIVMHGAPYVDPDLANTQGRLGRSLGCPALRPQIARQIIDTLRDGQWLFVYSPDASWLNQAASLSCASSRLAAEAMQRSALAATP